jgi:hypothetical protein
MRRSDAHILQENVLESGEVFLELFFDDHIEQVPRKKNL